MRPHTVVFLVPRISGDIPTDWSLHSPVSRLDHPGLPRARISLNTATRAYHCTMTTVYWAGVIRHATLHNGPYAKCGRAQIVVLLRLRSSEAGIEAPGPGILPMQAAGAPPGGELGGRLWQRGVQTGHMGNRMIRAHG